MSERNSGNGTSKSGRARRIAGLAALTVAGWAAPTGAAFAAVGEGPTDIPSALHTIAMLAVFFMLSSLRIRRRSGRWTVRFEPSPLPSRDAADR